MGDMTTTREGKEMTYFEEVARSIMRQHAITDHATLVAALRQAGFARFAAIRTADKIFG